MARVAEREISVRPPLKWAGGKRWQVPRLRAIWRAHQDRRLVEPFCGGLAVVLGLGPRRALLNDANPHLINFYRWLKRGLVVDLPMENNRTAFNRHRGRFNDLIEAGRTRGREAAALFYYLNRTGYNGLCRFNRQGAFNVPFGRYARINYQTDFLAFRDVFADWTFSNDDIADVRFRPDDFVYADPPYDVEFRQYGPLGFTWDDQVRTAERLADHAGPVVLVNQATPRIDRLYRTLGFRLRRLDGPRRISSSGDRRPAREIIATRNL